MYDIIKKERLTTNIVRMEIAAPLIAEKATAGQFVILRARAEGKSIPLSIADFDPGKGSITVIFTVADETTGLLDSLAEGEAIPGIAGPLGKATDTAGVRRVAVVSDEAGCSVSYPLVKKLQARGCSVDWVSGFGSHDAVILEKEAKKLAINLILLTQDGSLEIKGTPEYELGALLARGEKYDRVYTAGSLAMMKAVCKLTKRYGIKTIANMRAIIMDGTGICGGCRLRVGGQIKLACVDGPDFDGHQIDFTEAAARFNDETNTHKKCDDCNLLKAEGTLPNPDSFYETSPGFTAEQAQAEAKRCLNCKEKTCVSGCPFHTDIPAFIGEIAAGNFDAAYDIIVRGNSLPAVCGRICPNLCEEKCVCKEKGEPVAIRALERFATEYRRKNRNEQTKARAAGGCRIAVAGSGPMSLFCAGNLAEKGYEVTMFEAMPYTGGSLAYAIPEFRLPRSVLQEEISVLEENGVKIETNIAVGKTITHEELMKRFGFAAVVPEAVLGTPRFLNISGENAKGVYSANEILMRARTNRQVKEFQPGKKVVVVGGGYAAIGAARCARRLGADVRIVYRRTEKEMPAEAQEINQAKEEGVEFVFLAGPAAINTGADGRVCGIRCQEMFLSMTDASGRPRPVPLYGSEFVLEADSIIIAVGVRNNLAAGTVNDAMIMEMAAGKSAAEEIDRCLRLKGE